MVSDVSEYTEPRGNDESRVKDDERNFCTQYKGNVIDIIDEEVKEDGNCSEVV